MKMVNTKKDFNIPNKLPIILLTNPRNTNFIIFVKKFPIILTTIIVRKNIIITDNIDIKSDSDSNKLYNFLFRNR